MAISDFQLHYYFIKKEIVYSIKQKKNLNKETNVIMYYSKPVMTEKKILYNT
jgi:hypothetical protein